MRYINSNFPYLLTYKVNAATLQFMNNMLFVPHSNTAYILPTEHTAYSINTYKVSKFQVITASQERQCYIHNNSHVDRYMQIIYVPASYHTLAMAGII